MTRTNYRPGFESHRLNAKECSLAANTAIPEQLSATSCKHKENMGLTEHSVTGNSVRRRPRMSHIRQRGCKLVPKGSVLFRWIGVGLRFLRRTSARRNTEEDEGLSMAKAKFRLQRAAKTSEFISQR